MAPTLDAIRNCLDGGIPSVIATCALDGTPNVAYLSQVHFVDNGHVALSFQFFNKTRENVLTNPRATAQVVDPGTGVHYRLALHYLCTETEGPLFENMKAKLAGIASHTGMTKVFRLLGADVYQVLDIEAVPGARLPTAAPRRSVLSALRACADRLTRCIDLAGLLDQLLLGLEQEFVFDHAMVLLLDEKGDRLYTVASRGYAQSGIGSEIQMGEGVIGVAARERTPIRIGHMAREYLYSRAVRQSFQKANPAENLETEIPLPGLRESRSQLAVPMTLGARLFGVLYVESPQDQRFSYEDEDALVTLAQQLAMAIHLIEASSEVHEDTASTVAANTTVSGAPTTIRHYAANHSVFIDGDYLIKGVAGAIFWKLLGDFVKDRRIEFTNRELRLDPAIRLPDICENLEARLILLQKRLVERCDFMRLEKAGRGRLRLIVERPIKLVEMPGD
jgi:adenylate cyclase